LKLLNGPTEKTHALGRITCVVSGGDAVNTRLLVIDGQQRNTTCTLLLAAIRDVLLEDSISAVVNSALFPDDHAMKLWQETLSSPYTTGVNLVEGETLDFCAVLPTYYDRAPYFAAVLPSELSPRVAEGCTWMRPNEAKLYFMEQLSGTPKDALRGLVHVVLHRLLWLYFPIDVSSGWLDGTDDLQVIFERLAIRDATFCKPSRATEYANMGAADFVRNLLLGSFVAEDDTIRIYKELWLPIEQAATTFATEDADRTLAQILEDMLQAFLKKQPENSTRPQKAMVIGGYLYPQFRQWFTAALKTDLGSAPDGETAHLALERKTRILLQRLLDFALEYYRTGETKENCEQNTLGLVEQPLGNQLRKSSALHQSAYGSRSVKWSCSRCHYLNVGSSRQCDNCNFQKLATTSGSLAEVNEDEEGETSSGSI